ncbi:MAG: oleate hydratase, partial [Ignavibacteriaceae bacterium]|nr:oleate hydratase [Ignavibacteriaceae bacterium]
MKKCLVIGGGIAGLTAASYLSSKKIKVKLLESSPKPGGRAYSFFDQETQTILDNGQHIMMGCFKDTLALIDLIDARDNFIFQKNLRIEFLHKESGNSNLNAVNWFYPFNLLSALLKFKVFDSRDKLQLIKFLITLPFVSKKKLSNLTVKQWLIESDQTENLIKYFWEIIAIGALNSGINKASALLFYKVITQIFFRGNFASTIILQKYGLSKSLIEPLNNFIVKNEGDILLSKKVNGLVIEKDFVVSVLAGEEKLSDYDFIISAVPLYNLERIIDLNILNINNQFEYSTILNIHLWIDELDLQEKFYGFLDSPLHWIFVKDEHYNIVISDADYLAEKDQNE